MGKVTIQNETTRDPISLMGREAGVCWDALIGEYERDYKRGLDCITSGHGRVMEYPQVYMVLDGYSARVIRELYTHIGGGPTRLQASTRYINYETGFQFVTPPSLKKDSNTYTTYVGVMNTIMSSIAELERLGVPREDCAMLLPLGMQTRVVLRTNLRNLVEMSHQRLCSRAYWEFRDIMRDITEALVAYGETDDPAYKNEWQEVTKLLFRPKCEVCGFCTEKNSCGRMPKKGLGSNKPIPIVCTYSFSTCTEVHFCYSPDEVKDAIEKEYQRELSIQTEQNGHVIGEDLEVVLQDNYAKIAIDAGTGDAPDVIEWTVGTVY